MLLNERSEKTIGRLPSILTRAFADIKERREAVVLTTEPAWKAVKGIDINPHHLIYVDANTAAAMAAFADVCEGEVVYGVGGGLAIDTAKYVAAANELPLIAIPTILSTDAFLTDATGVRENGCVQYLRTKTPDTVIVDMDLLCNAPAAMRASGAAEILSIATALWDWQEAEKMGENSSDQQITPQAVAIAETLLQTLLENAREIGSGTPKGLKLLLDLLCMEVQLCHLCGHSRVEEGSEHYFTYALEKHLTSANSENLLHGELVGLGILLMAALQSQPWMQYRHALQCLQINYRPSAVAPEAVADTLINLSEYVVHHKLPYTVATTLRITPDIAKRTIQTVLDLA